MAVNKAKLVEETNGPGGVCVSTPVSKDTTLALSNFP